MVHGLSGSSTTIFINLQYEDDTFIFRNCDIKQAISLKEILWFFEIWSGLKSNFHKNSLVLLGQKNFTSWFIVSISWCKDDLFPIRYMGILESGPTVKAGLVSSPGLPREEVGGGGRVRCSS